MPLILSVSIFVINMLIDLADVTESGSEFQSILTLLLNTLIVALLMYFSLRILIIGPRLLIE